MKKIVPKLSRLPKQFSQTASNVRPDPVSIWHQNQGLLSLRTLIVTLSSDRWLEGGEGEFGLEGEVWEESEIEGDGKGPNLDCNHCPPNPLEHA